MGSNCFLVKYKLKMAEDKKFRHLTRIADTDLEGERPLAGGLRKIKGVNFNLANVICKLAGLNPTTRVGDLDDDQVKKLDSIIRNPSDNKIPTWMMNRRKDYEDGEDRHIILGDIKFIQGNDIKRLRMIKSYKGARHGKGLPVRGQKTKSNFRKNRGKTSLGVKKRAGAKAGK